MVLSVNYKSFRIYIKKHTMNIITNTAELAIKAQPKANLLRQVRIL